MVAQLCERELRDVRKVSKGEPMVTRRQPTGRRPAQRSLTKSKTAPPMSVTTDEESPKSQRPAFAPVQQQLDDLKVLAAEPARLAEALPGLLAAVQDLLAQSIPESTRYDPETADVTGYLVDLD